LSVRTARVLAVAYFVLFAAAVTWPGMVPFNRIRPLILGLPFSLAWIALWVTGGVFVLWMLHVAERKGDGE
jgi:preprotein translocase subunit SecY